MLCKSLLHVKASPQHARLLGGLTRPVVLYLAPVCFDGVLNAGLCLCT